MVLEPNNHSQKNFGGMLWLFVGLLHQGCYGGSPVRCSKGLIVWQWGSLGLRGDLSPTVPKRGGGGGGGTLKNH